MAGCRIVTVVAAKPGCGKTTFSANLATALTEGGSSVCVVDLDLDAGDLAILLGLQPQRDVAEAADMAGHLVPGGAQSLITPIRPGLDGVLTEAPPGSSLTADVVFELLAGLARCYDYLVVDTSAQYRSHVVAALDVAHHHVVIATPDRPAVRDLRRVLDMLDLLGYAAGRRSVVINRSDPSSGMSTDDIGKAASSSVAAGIPSTVDVPASVNRGIPLVAANPAHEYSRAVFRFVNEHIKSVNQKGNTHA